MTARCKLAFLVLTFLGPICMAAGFSVPCSNRVVEGELRWGPGRGVDYGIRDCSMLTLEDGDKKYGVTPKFDDDLKGARFSLYRISVDQNGEERVEQVDSKKIPLDGSQTMGEFDITVRHFREAKFSTNPMARVDFSAISPTDLKKTYGDDYCCINCKGFNACASHIRMTCGNCTKYSE